MSSGVVPASPAERTHSAPKSRKEVIRDELMTAARTAASTNEIGRNALSALEGQRETLRRTEDTLESNEYVLRRSTHVLRGMSWSGWLYNTLIATDEPVPEFNKSAGTKAVAGMTRANNAAALGDGATAETWRETAERDHAGRAASADSSDESKQLEAICLQVEDLKQLSLVMSDQVASQTGQLERIDNKTDRVRDKTLEVTLKAAQYTQRSRRNKPKLLGRFQFLEASSREFLAAVGEDLTLLPGTNRATFWNVFQKEDNLVGMQNCKTHKFIGSTFYGAVRCSGNYFGKQEECHVANVEPRTFKDESGILVLCKNWNRGGWLKRSSEPRPAHERPAIDSVTTCVSDKEGMLRFRSVLVILKENVEDEDK